MKTLCSLFWLLVLPLFSAIASGQDQPSQEKLTKLGFHIIPEPAKLMGTPFLLTLNEETGEVITPFKAIAPFKFKGTGYAALSLELQRRFKEASLYPDTKILVWSICSCTGSSPTECVDFAGDVWVQNKSLALYDRTEFNTLEKFLKIIRPRDTADLKRVEILRDGKTFFVDMTTESGQATELLCHDIVTVPKQG